MKRLSEMQYPKRDAGIKPELNEELEVMKDEFFPTVDGGDLTGDETGYDDLDRFESDDAPFSLKNKYKYMDELDKTNPWTMESDQSDWGGIVKNLTDEIYSKFGDAESADVDEAVNTHMYGHPRWDESLDKNAIMSRALRIKEEYGREEYDNMAEPDGKLNLDDAAGIFERLASITEGIDSSDNIAKKMKAEFDSIKASGGEDAAWDKVAGKQEYLSAFNSDEMYDILK